MAILPLEVCHVECVDTSVNTAEMSCVVSSFALLLFGYGGLVETTQRYLPCLVVGAMDAGGVGEPEI